MKQAILISASVVVSAYYAIVLVAAWLKPQWQKYSLLRARWQYGYNASRFGVTTQAAVAFSLCYLVVAHTLTGVVPRAALATFFACAALSFLAWAVDVAGQRSD